MLQVTMMLMARWRMQDVLVRLLQWWLSVRLCTGQV